VQPSRQSGDGSTQVVIVILMSSVIEAYSFAASLNISHFVTSVSISRRGATVRYPSATNQSERIKTHGGIAICIHIMPWDSRNMTGLAFSGC